jgi:hypothetical protein
MLTKAAMHERMWGQYPALGELLGAKQVPNDYFGFSSVSDNVFDSVRRLMEISILIRENSDEIGAGLRDPELCQELRREHMVADALAWVANRFHSERDEVSRLLWP